jgi:Zn-dependent peptidase ImmA (M78 family)
MPSKSVLKRGFKTEAEQIAEHYRQELGISKFDPLNAFYLAEHLNIPIFSVAEVFDDEKSHPDYLVLAETEKFHATWMTNEDGDKIIIHNTNHSDYRQQSNIMHELAHIIRKHEIPDEIRKLLLPLNLHYYNPLHEQEAKYLGGCLQITRPGLQWAIKRMTEDEISAYYKASVDMVRYRLNISGVMKQWRNRNC